MTPKPRSHDSYRRRKPAFEPRSRILVVCEGEKTEPGYLDSLKRTLGLHPQEIEVCGKECGSAPISVVKFAKDKVDSAGASSTRDKYDSVWCVMDVEKPKRPTLNNAMNLAKGNNFEVALSNPSFEYWYLLHFEQSAKPFPSCYQLIKYIKKEHGIDCDRDCDRLLELLMVNMDVALEICRIVRGTRGWKDDLRKYNPSTDVDKLVEELRAIAAQPRRSR